MKIERNKFHRSSENGVDVLLTESPEAKAQIKKRKKITKIVVWSVVAALLFVFVLNILIMPATGKYARVESVNVYNGDNPYICFDDEGGLLLSAHRAGGDLAPEETMAAFKLCMEADYVDVVEFDLHLTKDGVLVLMHDHEVDRTSNGPQVFGKKGVKINDKTLEELKQLNFGYNFETLNGEKPYQREMSAEELKAAEIQILTLDEILTYLEHEARPEHNLKYIIEIKDGGNIGKKAMDLLYSKMVEYGIKDRTIVGTFKGDITKYIDDKYPDLIRSAGITDVLNFYYAFLWGRKLDPKDVGFRVLQIPMGFNGFFDLATKAFVDYAHSLGIAVQYWTINDEDDMAYLQSIGADCIMTDNPELANQVLDG